MKSVALAVVALAVVSFAFGFRQHEASLPVSAQHPQLVAISFEQPAGEDYESRLLEIIARADTVKCNAMPGEARIMFIDCNVNAPALRPNPVSG